MPLLKEKDRLHLFEELKALTYPVTLGVFTQQFESPACRETREIAQEVAELAEMIGIEVFEYEANDGLATQFALDKIPALVVTRAGDVPRDFGIRFYGAPTGYLFTALMHAVMMVGTGESGLSPEAKAWVASIQEPIHVQVFASPTCLYCPTAVVMGHRLAIEGQHIQADLVAVPDFPHLAVKYNVTGLPLTVINETHQVEGLLSERQMMEQLQEVLGG